MLIVGHAREEQPQIGAYAFEKHTWPRTRSGSAGQSRSAVG